MHEALGDLVLFIDDDSYPVEENFVALAQSVMRDAPEVASVDLSPEGQMNFRRRSIRATLVLRSRWLPSAARGRVFAAVRLSLQLPGFFFFAKIFFHAFTQSPITFCSAMDAGYEVCLYTGLTIRTSHGFQLMSDEMRTHHLHARNEFWRGGGGGGGGA